MSAPPGVAGAGGPVSLDEKGQPWGEGGKGERKGAQVASEVMEAGRREESPPT